MCHGDMVNWGRRGNDYEYHYVGFFGSMNVYETWYNGQWVASGWDVY
jgi:hypothetical protein